MKTKISLLVVTQLFPSPSNNSFAGTFIVSLLESLAKKHNIVVIVPFLVTPKSLFKYFKILRTVKRFNFKIVYLPYFPFMEIIKTLLNIITRNDYRYFQKILIAKKLVVLSSKLHDRYHFDLVHGQEVYVGDEVANIGKVLRIPSIITLHSLYDFHLYSYGKPAMEEVLVNLGKANLLITVSNRVIDSYSNYIKKPISIIPNAYDPKNKKVPQSIFNIINKRKVILYCGHLIPSKKVDILLKAAALLKVKMNNNFIILIIGIGKEKNTLLEYINKTDLKRQVVFIGEVNPHNMSIYYQAADILVQPSSNESFSMVCLEAMSYGLPFIATENAGIAEYVTNEKEAFIVKPNNAQALFDKLYLLLTNEKLLHIMGIESKKRSKAFRNDIIANKITRLYKNVLMTQNNAEK